MQPPWRRPSLLAIFNLGGGEIILVLALVLILFGARKLPDLARGLCRGIFEFRKAIDDESVEAGPSVGGIYGKPTAQAITPDTEQGIQSGILRLLFHVADRSLILIGTDTDRNLFFWRPDVLNAPRVKAILGSFLKFVVMGRTSASASMRGAVLKESVCGNA